MYNMVTEMIRIDIYSGFILQLKSFVIHLIFLTGSLSIKWGINDGILYIIKQL